MKTSDSWTQLETEIVECRQCPRLVEWREKVAKEKKRAYRDRDYWGRGVPGFGDHNARILVLGLAPGAHGSNRTGRMFTGDSSGNFLYPALFRAGFANNEYSTSRDDKMVLTRVYITAVCRCAPPENKPAPQEILDCHRYLERELTLLTSLEGVVALGQIAFHEASNFLRGRSVDIPVLKFGHGVLYQPGPGVPWLLASYHPSQQNTQTGRLTPEMFDLIWQTCRDLLNGTPRDETYGR